MKHKEMSIPKVYSSEVTKSVLKIQDCDLAHIRNAGKLKFEKKGNAFLYSKESLDEFKKKNI